MKCPYCGRENYDGSNFCIGCGAKLPYVSYKPVKKPDSAFKKFVVSCLKAGAYFGVYFAIENIIVLIYELFIMGQMGINSFMDGGYSGLDDLYEELYDRMAQNMNLLLILATALTILTYCIIFSMRYKKPLQEMHISPVPWKEAVLAFFWGIALNPVVSVILSVIPIPESLIESYNSGYELMYGGPILIEIINVAIFTPIIEEIVFRGLIFTRLRKGMNETLAFILTCIIFGAAHGHIISFVYAGLLCVAMLALFRKHDSILLSMALHMGFNGSSYLMEYFPQNVLLVYALCFVCIAGAIGLGFALFYKPKDDEDEDEEKPAEEQTL